MLILFIIFLNHFSVAYYIAHVLADQHAVRKVFVCNDIVAHSLFVDKSKRPERLFLILLENLLLLFAHLH
jgi:hypothetical protein